MDHYLDIRLRPEPELSAPVLLGALFDRLHRALVSLRANDIGVSFPGHALQPRSLGSVLRVHSNSGRLAQLMALDWLGGMRDHVELGSIAAIPAEVQHRSVRRVQPKTNAERLRRRHMKRHQVSAEVARERIPDSVVQQRVALPFAAMRSQSTGQAFSLFIDHGTPKAEPVPGVFSHYGLAVEATVPWF